MKYIIFILIIGLLTAGYTDNTKARRKFLRTYDSIECKIGEVTSTNHKQSITNVGSLKAKLAGIQVKQWVEVGTGITRYGFDENELMNEIPEVVQILPATTKEVHGVIVEDLPEQKVILYKVLLAIIFKALQENL